MTLDTGGFSNWSFGDWDGAPGSVGAASNFSRFGLANAVTNAANELEDYDRASEFETFGGMDMSPAARLKRAQARAAYIAEVEARCAAYLKRFAQPPERTLRR